MHRLIHANCFDWLRECPPHSLHAVCTDPPYGVLEFTEKEVAKLRAGRGGVWRLPPTIGGSRRDPLPRFTVLTEAQKSALRQFFHDWGKLLFPALVPGAHVCVAGHPMLQPLVQIAMAEAGFEIRAAIMRMYFSFRGGDRPKNAEREFPEVCVTPKGAYEPWMLFLRCKTPFQVDEHRSAKPPSPIILASSRSISCASWFAAFCRWVKACCLIRSWVLVHPSPQRKLLAMSQSALKLTATISRRPNRQFHDWPACIRIFKAPQRSSM
jgi:hypothetical protein